MNMQRPEKRPVRWQSIATGLLLAALLAVPIVVVATSSPMRRGVSAETMDHPSASLPQQTYPSRSRIGDVGSFAHGYLEFDVNPSQPGGVPGFDSWPPGSSHP